MELRRARALRVLCDQPLRALGRMTYRKRRGLCVEADDIRMEVNDTRMTVGPVLLTVDFVRMLQFNNELATFVSSIPISTTYRDQPALFRPLSHHPLLNAGIATRTPLPDSPVEERPHHMHPCTSTNASGFADGFSESRHQCTSHFFCSFYCDQEVHQDSNQHFWSQTSSDVQHPMPNKGHTVRPTTTNRVEIQARIIV